MRKYLIVAIAAMLSIALASVAVAQMLLRTSPRRSRPTKAGTKKKPKEATLKLFVKNNENDTTVERSCRPPEAGQVSR